MSMGEIDDGCCSTQLIDGNGEFNVVGLDNFMTKMKLSDCGLSYAVVAIMGPQSSGKSTLLNHLFKTSFKEMDAFAGRSQTTKGIWMARCVGIEPFTVAMDLEGTDSNERGQDDTTFEKQSALFALAVADILLINMWCHDIGREHASNRPLLNTVFQVMMQLFSPRKTTLLFVIRDKTKTPMEKLEHLLREDIQKIWDLVHKPEAHKNTPLSELFNVEIVALSNYEEKEKLFKQEVSELRQRFFHSISPGRLAGDRRGVVPASEFSFCSREIWNAIKEDKNLNIPAQRVMLATVRCVEIANEKLHNLKTDELIDGNGEFNVEGLDNFVKKTKLSDCGLSYAVVAIMGPQSSGKSTLLNHLFKTRFREMDAFAGRSQTTKGIWMARCVGIEPFTVAMDLEGTDGRERGEDDTTFEKQSALFALAVADIVLINMWCHDIGREQASNKPLLKTVFQVMMRLFSPRKTTLLFVIRDKTKTPMDKLEPVLREDIQKIWDLVRKPEAHKNAPLSEFFNVEIVALSNYEEKEKLFKEEVAELRQRFFHSISPGGLAGDRRGVVPASGFSFSSQQIWKVIKENRDLDLPAHKVMVATVRCEEIANEKLHNLATDENLLELQEAVQSGPVPGFGKKLSSILEKYFSEYDAEAVYFEGVRKEKRLQLKIKALDFVYSAYATMLGHLRSSALESFTIRLEQSLNQGEGFAKAVRDSQQSCLIVFDKGCEDATVEQATWDASKIREKLCRDIDSHTSSARTAKLSKLTANYEERLIQALSGPVESLFETGGKETWPSIRKLLKRETETAVTDFLDVVAGFELDHATIDSMVQNLKDYSQGLVEKKARDEAAKILIRMKDRFSTVFSHEKDSMPRVWTGKEDIRAITKDARAEALSLLAVMAAIRLDERPDNIESTLFSSLMDGTVSVATSHNRSLGTSTDPLASSTWEEVPPIDVLLTPVQCKSLWRQFKSGTEYTVTQAISAQEAHKRNSNWLPPAWAIVLMIVLGFNEFMMLLKNPLYLFGFFVAFLLSKALWVQLDIPREFQHGALTGVLSITSKLLPTVMNLLRKLAEEAQGKTTQEAPEYSASQSYKQQSPSHSISSTVAESVSSNISQMADDDAEYSRRPALVQRRNTSNVQESEISQI